MSQSPTAPPAGAKSRGEVVKELAGTTSIDEVTTLLPTLAQGTNPFELIAFHGTERQGYRWSGTAMEPFSPDPPLTSSSFQFEEVKNSRLSRYAEDPHNLARYHARDRGRAQCFHRPDESARCANVVAFPGLDLRAQYPLGILGRIRKSRPPAPATFQRTKTLKLASPSS